jgi:hypothetical protein
MDSEKRKALLSQIQKIVAIDEPYINLWYTDNVCVHRARIGWNRHSPIRRLQFSRDRNGIGTEEKRRNSAANCFDVSSLNLLAEKEAFSSLKLCRFLSR